MVLTTIQQNKKLAIVGAVHVDDIARSSSPLVSRASNPVSWEQQIGGVAANAARAAALCALDHQTIELTAAVGEDPLAAALSSALSACNVTPHLLPMSGCLTGRYTAIMNNDGELYIGLADVALAEQLDLNHVNDIARRGPYCAMLVDANLSNHCLASLATLALRMTAPLAALTVSPSKALRLRPIADKINLLFCNRREALALIANDDAAAELSSANPVSAGQLADGLSELGFTQIVLTDAQAPILVQDGNQRYQIPVPAIDDPYTVNGAGDAMAGGCFAAWAAGENLYDSVKNTGLALAAGVVRGEHRAIGL